MTVLHKRYSEFAALRSMLTNGLSHSEEPEPEPEPEPPGGGAGGDEDPSVLVRGSSSGESLSSLLLGLRLRADHLLSRTILPP